MDRPVGGSGGGSPPVYTDRATQPSRKGADNKGRPVTNTGGEPLVKKTKRNYPAKPKTPVRLRKAAPISSDQLRSLSQDSPFTQLLDPKATHPSSKNPLDMLDEYDSDIGESEDESAVPSSVSQPHATGVEPTSPSSIIKSSSPVEHVSTPVVSVTADHVDPMDVKPAYPLTPEQKEQKGKFAVFFSTLLMKISQNKNMSSMIFGGAISILAIILLASPAAPAGAAILAFGFTIAMVGFSNAMYNEADVPSGSPQPQPQPQPQPDPIPDKEKKAKGSEPDSGSASTSASDGKSGKFVKVEPSKNMPLSDGEAGSSVHRAPPTPLGDFQVPEQLAADIAKTCNHLRPPLGAEVINLSLEEAVALNKQLEAVVVEVASEFAARADMKISDFDLMHRMSAAMSVAKDAIKTRPNMTREKRGEVIQDSFAKLIDDSGATYKQIAHLSQHIEKERAKLVVPEHAKIAVHALFDSWLALIKGVMNKMGSPSLDDFVPNSPSHVNMMAHMQSQSSVERARTEDTIFAERARTEDTIFAERARTEDTIFAEREQTPTQYSSLQAGSLDTRTVEHPRIESVSSPSTLTDEEFKRLTGIDKSVLTGTGLIRHFWIFENATISKYQKLYTELKVTPEILKKARENTLVDAVKILIEDNDKRIDSEKQGKYQPINSNDFKRMLTERAGNSGFPEKEIVSECLRHRWFNSGSWKKPETE